MVYKKYNTYIIYLLLPMWNAFYSFKKIKKILLSDFFSLFYVKKEFKLIIKDEKLTIKISTAMQKISVTVQHVFFSFFVIFFFYLVVETWTGLLVKKC